MDWWIESFGFGLSSFFIKTVWSSSLRSTGTTPLVDPILQSSKHFTTPSLDPANHFPAQTEVQHFLLENHGLRIRCADCYHSCTNHPVVDFAAWSLQGHLPICQNLYPVLCQTMAHIKTDDITTSLKWSQLMFIIWCVTMAAVEGINTAIWMLLHGPDHMQRRWLWQMWLECP